MSKPLFEEFKKQKPENWTELLKKDLRGEPLDALLWKTQGLKGKPFYTSEDIDFETFNYSNFSKNSMLFGDRFWVNYQPIVVTDFKSANQKALNALENGANGILFELKVLPDFKKLLSGIQAQFCHLSFHLSSAIDSKVFLTGYQEYLMSENVTIDQISGFIQSNSLDNPTIGHLKTNHYKIETHGKAAINFAMTLSQLIDEVDANATTQTEVEEYLKSCVFLLSTSKDFFIEIAKHRALRRLIDTVANGYGIENVSSEITSQVGPWENEIDDPHSFMLHATTEAMSAILGGTDGIVVQPFYNTFPSKSALAERMARNISPILREESYLDKIVDPAAGSYYIETLTEDIFNSALALLKEIEQQGGLSSIDTESFIAKNTAQ